MKQARAALGPTGTGLAIDLFGSTAFNLDDTGVGQRIELRIIDGGSAR